MAIVQTFEIIPGEFNVAGIYVSWYYAPKLVTKLCNY